MAKTETPRDNRATVTLAGIEFEIEASNGACLAYANEFRGKLDKPFTGNLKQDIATIHSMIAAGGSGEMEALEQVPLAVWAMSFAAGGDDSTYDAFCKRHEHDVFGYFELADAYSVLVELADRTFFRLTPRFADALKPDEKEER